MTDYLKAQTEALSYKMGAGDEFGDGAERALENVLDLLDTVRCDNCAYWGSERLKPKLSQRCARLEAGPVMIPAERGSVRGTTDAQIYTQPDFYCKSFMKGEE